MGNIFPANLNRYDPYKAYRFLVFFGNALGTLVLDGRAARFELHKAVRTHQSEDRMDRVTGLSLD